MYAAGFGVILVVLGVVRIYWKYFMRSCKSTVDLSGKTVIVTGGNAGLGYCTALDLATRNARVILACRNAEKANVAKNKIIAETGNKNVAVKLVDTSSLKSVKKFAEQILKEESRLDILVNNAGIMYSKEGLTEDGLEPMYATNHFGPFLLTNLLLDLLKSSLPSRIVNVSSNAYRYGDINFDNMKIPMSFEGRRTYSNTKLANILFTSELSDKLKGEGVTTYAVHPGLCATDLFRFFPSPFEWIFLNLNPVIKTCEEGAQTIIYCAVEEGIEKYSGQYWSNCRLATPKPHATDKGVARKLWEASETMTKLV